MPLLGKYFIIWGQREANFDFKSQFLLGHLNHSVACLFSQVSYLGPKVHYNFVKLKLFDLLGARSSLEAKILSFSGDCKNFGSFFGGDGSALSF